MHSIQWQTFKPQTNQHWSTTRWSSVFNIINIYTSEIPFPPKNIQIVTYADDLAITASHTKHRKAQQLIQPYLLIVGSVIEWLERRDCDRHDIGSKPTRTILVCCSEKNFTEIFPAWWSWQAVLNFSHIAIKLK